MKEKFFLLLVVAIYFFVGSESFAQHDWTEQINAFKPMVVNIEKSSEMVFETEKQGTIYATGFIIDADRGIIATNAHVTGKSPSYVRINFYDGSFTEAKILYWDPVHDFGFYKIDPNNVGFKLQAIKRGSWYDLAMGDELLFIGNNEKEEYSVKFGTVANININKGDRHGSYIHTTFNSAGGSSGSPVWNTKGEVIGIHTKGTQTSDFELPINYLVDALQKIQTNIPIKRGEIGVDLELITIGEAINHFGLPSKVASQIKAKCKGTPKVMQIESIIPRSTGKKPLQEGDIIYSVAEKPINDNLYLFDALLNENVDKTVPLEVYRSGKRLKISVYVENIEKAKINKFAHFAGAIFHNVTPHLRWKYDFSGDGVNMSYAAEGSSFSHLGDRDEDDRYFRVILTEVNGHPVRNIDEFIEACSKISDGQHTYVIVHDFMQFNTSLKPKTVTVNLKYGPLELFAWNDKTLDWDKVEVGKHIKGIARF